VARPGERPIYQLFKDEVPELAGAVDDLAGESPDVIACQSGRSIGVELTGYFHGEAPARRISQVQQERFQQDVVQEAQRIFESSGGPYLHVAVGWHDRLPTDLRNVLACAIADVVAAHFPTVPATRAHVELRIENYDLPEPLNAWLMYISVVRTTREMDHFWLVPQAGYTDALPESIRERIADKEKRLVSYRPCDETWLLIHSGSHRWRRS
jgi:hypothetical protein